jgi:hypothetical protein
VANFFQNRNHFFSSESVNLAAHKCQIFSESDKYLKKDRSTRLLFLPEDGFAYNRASIWRCKYSESCSSGNRSTTSLRKPRAIRRLAARSSIPRLFR